MLLWPCEACVLSGAEQVVLVVNPSFDSANFNLDPNIEIIQNSDFESGLSSSIRCGIAAVRPKLKSAVIVLGDQPLITAPHLQNLVNALEEMPVAATKYPNGALGVPAAFSRSQFPALQALKGDQGAKLLIDSLREKVLGVPFAHVLDIDFPSDLEAAS